MPEYDNVEHFSKTILRYKRQANISLSRIGRELNFNVPVNFGIARHCFATAQKLNGTPVAFISEAMGHSSLSTTEHYLKGLPSNQLQKMNEHLLDFEMV